MNKEIQEAKEYLESGGLGEVMGFAYAAADAAQPKVQMDTSMAIALCLLVNDALAKGDQNELA